MGSLILLLMFIIDTMHSPIYLTNSGRNDPCADRDPFVSAAKGELPAEEKVSKAQMGAFFGAMTLRANCFPAPTQWSAGERKAMNELWPSLSQSLPHEILFLADPEGTLMGGSSSEIGPKFSGQSAPDTCLVGALREVLYGRHLGYEEVTKLLKDVLPLTRPGSSNGVSDALLAAFMICSRMNGETDKELEAYCMAFDDELGEREGQLLFEIYMHSVLKWYKVSMS